MAHYKRRYPRRWFRCGMCTDRRYGNSANGNTTKATQLDATKAVRQERRDGE